MDGLALAKGTTALGGVLGTGAGVYYGSNSNLNELIKNWGNVKGWLLYEGKELIGVGDGSVGQWTKASNRYSSYLSFKVGTETMRYEIKDFTASANEMQKWCEEKLSAGTRDKDYERVRKWCTKHNTMKDKLESEKMELDLNKQTRYSYESLSTALRDSIEDKHFLALTPSETSSITDDDKKNKAKSWCEKKANIDFKDGEEYYETFKKECGKKKAK